MALEDVLFRDLADQLGAGVYLTDRRRRVHLWSHGAERLTGYPAEEVVGKSCAHGILQHVDEQGTSLCGDLCPLAATMADGEPRDGVVFLHHRDGHRFPVRISTAPVRDAEGAIIGGVEIFQDHSTWYRLSDRVAELEEKALLDELTGLPNRRLLDQELELRLEEKRRYGWPFGVLFVDIDHFKAVNDTWGHDVGDEVLAMVSRTLRAGARASDVVGRWGGEEFVVILAAAEAEEARITGERLRALVASSSTKEDPVIQVTASFGVAIHREGESTTDLLKRADAHLYQAKQGGRDRVEGP